MILILILQIVTGGKVYDNKLVIVEFIRRRFCDNLEDICRVL